MHQSPRSARHNPLCDGLATRTHQPSIIDEVLRPSHNSVRRKGTFNYTTSHSQLLTIVMRATLLFALLAYTRAYQLPRSRRALVVPQRRYDLQPRSTPDEATTDEADAVEEAPAAPSRPARYDVTKLVDSSEGPGFNQFDPVLTATRGLSRRFGLAGGLAIFGILLVVEGDEIIKALGTQEPVRSRRPAALRCLHAIDATRGYLTMPWVVSGPNLRPFGPRRGVAAMACW